MLGMYFSKGLKNGALNIEHDIFNLEFSATIEETHEWSAESTEFPVEDGSPISDHVIEKPNKLKLKGVFTNSSLRGEDLGKFFGPNSGKIPKTQHAFNALYDVMKDRLPVVVYTKHAVYYDMIITNITIPRDSQGYDSIHFAMDLIHIRKVQTKTVDVPKGISEKKTAKSGKPMQKKTESPKDSGAKSVETKEPKAALKSLFEGKSAAEVINEAVGRVK